MRRYRMPLDTYDIVPGEQRAYLMNYGRHFNEKMFGFAVSLMRGRDGSRHVPVGRDAVLAALSSAGVSLENDTMYDAAYAYNMAVSDFLGSSLEDERHVCLYVGDLVDDPDQGDGFLFSRFVSDCVNNGVPIEWGDML